jgi:hypothetical protein
VVGGTRQTLRRLFAGTAIAATVLLVAAPVAAKPGDPADDPPPSTAYVTGPGIDVPIVVDGRAALRMLYLTSFRAFGQAEPDVPTARELGPRYEAWYFVTAADGRLHLITQDLFPCAAGSVWAYTPTEQGPFARGFFPVPASTGWWHSTAMAGTVGGWGLPCSARAASALVAGGSGWGGPMATAWVLIGLAVVGAVRSSRRRFRGEPERTRS